MNSNPGWLNPDPWRQIAESCVRADVESALFVERPGMTEFARLVSPAADALIENMAQRALALTRSHFGRTIDLYAPLYVSNYCSGGCAYCGFASDRTQKRHKLSMADLQAEMEALKSMGIEEVLLLTGERTAEAGFDYLLECVSAAAAVFHKVTAEAFAMSEQEYRTLVDAGCTGVTLYQETYERETYETMHRWGEKKSYLYRLAAPDRALRAGMRSFGIGALFGLGDPLTDAISLFQHAVYLRTTYWQSGIAVSFPRLQMESGGFSPPEPLPEQMLARIVFAFRICLPDVPLVLSTRERPGFRDGMAGIGISRMSVASRTTVGGYHGGKAEDSGQFDVSDSRNTESFCSSLRGRGLEPVFKNWDSVFLNTKP
jgi:2-iminoacetate synthase